MCGIVGFAGTAKADSRERFIELCHQSCIRGVHAFGIAWYSSGIGVRVFKSLSFNEVINAIPNPLPSSMLFHNRYSTSGDYRNMNNNQPIFIEGNALVFNGTVDMGTKQEMEKKYGFRMQTDNDGEIVLRDFVDGEPFEHIKGSIATFAGVLLSKDGSMTAFRNKMRPLWCFLHGVNKFITSTRDIAARAGFEENNGNPIDAFKLFQL